MTTQKMLIVFGMFHLNVYILLLLAQPNRRLVVKEKQRKKNLNLRLISSKENVHFNDYKDSLL